MKKSLLALLFAVALAVPALAENMWIGGSLGYSNTSPKEGDSTSAYYIEPEFGYNVDEKLDIGIDLGYAYDEAGFVDLIGVADKTTTIGIAPFVRYKMFEIGDFAFFRSTYSILVKFMLQVNMIPCNLYAISSSSSATITFSSKGYLTPLISW